MYLEFTMNKLTYFGDGLISSLDDIEILATKKAGKILVLSDTHGLDAEILEAVLDNFGQEVDVLLFCGDGFSDVGEVIQKALTNEKLQEKLPSLVAYVRGNNDERSYVISAPYSEEMNKEKTENHDNFKIIQLNIPESITFILAGRRVFATHGHRHCVNYGFDQLYAIADNLPADMIFYGHTHKAYFEETHGTLFLNPGSLCYPRGGQEPSLAIVSFPGIEERYVVEYYNVDKNILGSYNFERV